MAQKRALITDDEALQKPFNLGQFLRVLRYLKPYRKRVFGALGLMVIASVCSLSAPYLMRIAIDEYIDKGDIGGLPFVIGAMILFSVIAALCLRFRVRLLDTAGLSAISKLREDLFAHIQSLSFSFFDNRSAGKIMVRVINDVNSLNDLFTNGIINILIDCFSLLVILGLMFSISVQLTLVSMCTLPIIFLVIFALKNRMRAAWQIVRRKISNLNGYLHESLAGMRITQSFVREEENAALFDEVNEDIRKGWMQAILINNCFWPGIDLVGTLGTVLVYVFGLQMLGIEHATLQVGTLLSIIWYLGRFWEPVNNMSNFYNSLLVAAASMERIFEIMDTPSDIADAAGAVPLPPIEGRVTFERVSFGYDPDKLVLEDISFDIQPGQTIALVGPTGAGKTTVVNLISRFYDATGGAVRIDGHDIRHVTLDSLRQQMGVMMQDSFIFSGTIRDNIRYGRLDATDEEIVEAAIAVNAHEFIMQMEKGYDTEVNERGSRLSVGEKQLISFARALLADPKILILDEATSSIDTQTEMLIQKALDRLLRGRTSFVIAHRLSTIRQADCIMVISDRMITEQGTHDELMAQGGHYHDLCQAQYRFLDVG